MGKLISATTKPHHTMRGAVWGGFFIVIKINNKYKSLIFEVELITLTLQMIFIKMQELTYDTI